jgi:hypothetical protein
MRYCITQLKGYNMITVNQLIQALQAVENKESLVELSIQIYDKKYPFYASIKPTAWDNIVFNAPYDGTVRINCSLKAPNGYENSYYTIREMKKK